MTENEPRNKKFLMTNIGLFDEILKYFLGKKIWWIIWQIWRQMNIDISVFYFSEKKMIRIIMFDNNVLFLKWNILIKCIII